MQRGFNSVIYYVEQGPLGSDYQVISAVKAKIAHGEWTCEPRQIFKDN